MEEFPVNFTCLHSGKEVYASKIAAIGVDTRNAETDTGKRILRLEDGNVFGVSHQFMRDHGPVVGGYYFIKENGDKRFKHAKSFEEAHALIDHVPFDEGEEDLSDAPDPEPKAIGVDPGAPEGDKTFVDGEEVKLGGVDLGVLQDAVEEAESTADTEDNSGQGEGESILDDNANDGGGDVNA